MNGTSPEEDTPVLLKALVALLVDEREARLADDPEAKKTELLLADAGMNVQTIATLIGKKPDAVRKAIQRARKRDGATSA